MSITKLAAYVEKAYTDILKDPDLKQLIADYGCTVEKYGTSPNVYLIGIVNKLLSKPMRLAVKLRELGWYSSVATDKYLIVSRKQQLSNLLAKEYAKSANSMVMQERRVDWEMSQSSLDQLKGYIEMASYKLTSVTVPEKIAEISRLGVDVRDITGTYVLVFPEKKNMVTPGDILSARARLEAYSKAIWPDLDFTHFVVKAKAKNLYYCMGVAGSMDKAVSVAASA